MGTIARCRLPYIISPAPIEPQNNEANSVFELNINARPQYSKPANRFSARSLYMTPATPAAFIREQSDGVLLSIKVQPRASSNAIGEPLGSELRVKVTAPPVDAAANEAVLRFLADCLDCPRNRIELIKGHKSRHKVIRVSGIPSQTIVSKLLGGG
jgi:uncharacterized protein (TIGR00251 family)